ncbi:hypothetical protein Xenpb_01662 [Xenorhabdus sp. PB62.4]|nr:hypothetical protein [Xenorhabdus sp. PB62.4]
MRYICALLEADILGHLTLRLRMKVSRWYSPAATHLAGQNWLCLTLIDTALIGTTFTCILHLSR